MENKLTAILFFMALPFALIACGSESDPVDAKDAWDPESMSDKPVPNKNCTETATMKQPNGIYECKEDRWVLQKEFECTTGDADYTLAGFTRFCTDGFWKVTECVDGGTIMQNEKCYECKNNKLVATDASACSGSVQPQTPVTADSSVCGTWTSSGKLMLQDLGSVMADDLQFAACPEGSHMPTADEWNAFKEILVASPSAFETCNLSYVYWIDANTVMSFANRQAPALGVPEQGSQYNIRCVMD